MARKDTGTRARGTKTHRMFPTHYLMNLSVVGHKDKVGFVCPVCIFGPEEYHDFGFSQGFFFLDLVLFSISRLAHHLASLTCCVKVLL